ncbi:uncharacterized protein HGUI_03538 [Hanseniaspora guilliermondii]|uniref:Large ribosomal subunit protein mL54 n=1 Tax=Hanseniaspora guilliermondii TaxID=56406 RepID=A0A1L0CRZ2_9ASCO|nr:uncharacterized protein HGUI_03538 [Hanseniaspora guilliermondii]
MLFFKSSKLISNTSIKTRSINYTLRRFNSTSQPSICPAGTILNLKIKNKQDEPVALEDSEYPEWLWTITEEKSIKPNMTVEEELKVRKILINHERRTQIRKTNELSKKK